MAKRSMSDLNVPRGHQEHLRMQAPGTNFIAKKIEGRSIDSIFSHALLFFLNSGLVS